MKESFCEHLEHIALCAFLYPRDKSIFLEAQFYASLVHAVENS